MRRLHKDFETASAVDLKAAGLDNYVRHWSTHVLLMAWAFDDDEPQLWLPGQPYPSDVVEHEAAGGEVVAYNAAFEFHIHNTLLRLVAPMLRLEQLNCVMARANAMALPPALDNVAPALGLDIVKDKDGYRLMLQMCKPVPLPRGVKGYPIGPDGREVYEWKRDPESMRRLGEYCLQDVRVEQAVDRLVLALSPKEREVWVLDRKINDRGVAVDVPNVKRIVRVLAIAKDKLDDKMHEVTGGAVDSCTQLPALKRFCELNGLVVGSLDKEAIVHILEEKEGLGVRPVVREALKLRQIAGKSSVRKFNKMLERVSPDGRLRDMFAYHAASTGRWGGRAVQLQNLVRWKNFKMADAEAIIKVLGRFTPEQASDWIDVVFDNAYNLMPFMLRPMLVGDVMLCADAANIEGRGLAWLAGEQWKLDAFEAYDAGAGPDLYKVMAARILGKPIATVTDDERQTYGKVPELACGYQGGVGAFKKMGAKVSDEKADEIKTAWRLENPRIVQLWYDTERAAMDAVRHPGRKFKCGYPGRETTYLVNGSALYACLPSGRVLTYMYPSIKDRETPWGEEREQVHYWSWDSEKNRWAEDHSYGGKWVENNTQAICRDILAGAMIRLEAAGFPIVLHVHDEPGAELKDAGVAELRRFEQIASEVPEWANGLPIVFKGWVGARYRKS